MSEIVDHDVNRYLAMSKEELFARLVPEDEQVAYSEDGRIARGRQILRDLSVKIKEVVCPVYQQRSGAVNNSIELVVLVAGALAGQAQIWSVPVLPLAALIVKIGIDVFCPGRSDA